MSFNLEAIQEAMDRMVDAMSEPRRAGGCVLPEGAYAAPLRGAVPTPARLWDTPVVIAPHLPPSLVWVRPGRVPSKAAGRRGTRRAWKRANSPRFLPIGRPEPVMAAGRLYVGADDYRDLQRLAGYAPRYDSTAIARTGSLGA